MELRKKNNILVQGIVICFILISCSNAVAIETKVGMEERIARLETKVDEGFKRVEQRIDNLEKTLNQRINGVENSLNQRIDGVEKRIEDLRGLIYVMLAGMISLVGFILWDRRTTIAPVVHELKEVVKQEGLIIDVLKRYAQFEPKMAQAIKTVGL